jgi:P27 family predicted phage terminase small subunit
MGKRGPAPKPTTLKVLEGNPGKRPLNENEPKPVPSLPEKPTWLKLRYYTIEDTKERDILKYANEFWDKNTSKLFDLGLLTEIDSESYAILCVCYGEWVSSQIKTIIEGETVTYEESGYTAQHPYALRADKAYKKYKDMAQEFGLTPSSRSGIDVKNPDPEEEMEGLLFGVK